MENKYITNIKKFIDTEIGDNYNICVKDTGYIFVSQSPFYNCQMSTIGRGYTMTMYKNKECIIEVLKKIRTLMCKNMFLLDIKQKYVDKFKEMYEPFCSRITITPYTSTNDSEMNLVQIVLDVDKLKQ